MSSVAHSLKAMLAAKAMAMNRLAPSTRHWLHVDKYGQLLGEDAVVDSTNPGTPIGQKPSVKSVVNHYRMGLWRFAAESESSKWARAWSYFMIFTILLSTVGFVLESVPAFSKRRDPDADRTFTWIEGVTVQIFLVDYILRIVSCPNLYKFVFQPLNIIDLVSIVPWYVELALADSGAQGTAVFRVLRLLRVFRILKLGSRYKKLLIVTSALAKSLDMLCLVAFLVSMVVLISSTLMYFAERGDYNEDCDCYVRKNEVYSNLDGTKISPFESIPATFWWSIVTIMTVGYGDHFPITVGGRIIAGVTMIFGILALALPIAVIGTNFTNEWDEYKKRQSMQPSMSPNLRALLQSLGDHSSSMEDFMRMFDSADQKIDEARSQLSDKGNLRQRDIELTLLQRQSSFKPAQIAAAQQAAAGLAQLASGAGLLNDDGNDPELDHSRHGLRRVLSVKGGAAGRVGSIEASRGGSPSVVAAAGALPKPKGTTPETLKAAVDQLAGTPLHQRVINELKEIVKMQDTVKEPLSFMQNLLQATTLVYGQDVPELTDQLRLQYRQMHLLEHQTMDLKAGLDALTAEILQLDDDLTRTGLEVVMDVLGGGVHKGASKPGVDTPIKAGKSKAVSTATSSTRDGSSSAGSGSNATLSSMPSAPPMAAADQAVDEATSKAPSLPAPPVIPAVRPPSVLSTQLLGQGPAGGRAASAIFPSTGSNRVAPERSGTSLVAPKAAVPPVSIDMAHATLHTAGAQQSARSSNNGQAPRTSSSGQTQQWPALESDRSRPRGSSGSGTGIWHV